MLGAALAQAESLARKATLEELNRKRKDDDDAGAPITARLLAAQLADFAASVYALQTDIATGYTELAALLKATDLEHATAARTTPSPWPNKASARPASKRSPTHCAPPSSASKPTTKPAGVYLIGNWNNNLLN